MSEKELLKAAIQAQSKAYAPYSCFLVGAAILDENDNIHCGSNVENSSYPLGVCAEQSAISAMIQGNGSQIKKILIVNSGDKTSSPCGGCRQRILEFATKETEVLLCTQGRIEQRIVMSDLLPFSFNKSYLKDD